MILQTVIVDYLYRLFVRRKQTLYLLQEALIFSGITSLKNNRMLLFYLLCMQNISIKLCQ